MNDIKCTHDRFEREDALLDNGCITCMREQITALTAELDAAKKRVRWYAERVLNFLEDDLGNSPTKEQLKEAVELTHFWTDDYRAFLSEVLKDLLSPNKLGDQMKFRKKPVVIEAHQWFKNGDHPNDNCDLYDYPDGNGSVFQRPGEGKIVRYFRRPDVSGDSSCRNCGNIMHLHGWIDTKEGGHIVCPGDWIITGIAGEYYPCKPYIFAATYEEVSDSANTKLKCGNSREGVEHED